MLVDDHDGQAGRSGLDLIAHKIRMVDEKSPAHTAASGPRGNDPLYPLAREHDDITSHRQVSKAAALMDTPADRIPQRMMTAGHAGLSMGALNLKRVRSEITAWIGNNGASDAQGYLIQIEFRAQQARRLKPPAMPQAELLCDVIRWPYLMASSLGTSAHPAG